METKPLIPNRRGVTSKLVISYELSEDAMTLVQKSANESTLGGHSNIREPDDRMQKVGEDALVDADRLVDAAETGRCAGAAKMSPDEPRV